MIYFGQDADSERPGDSERKTPRPHPVDVRQRPATGRVVTAGPRPEVAA